MRQDKKKAIVLRKQGKSYNEISEILKVPKSTLSAWLSQIPWSAAVRKKLVKRQGEIVGKITKARWAKWREGFREEAKLEFNTLAANPLFIIGLCLYLGEGDHQLKTSQVKLINTDPKVIDLFSRFLREAVKVPEKKIRAWLIIYKDLDDEKCKKYWRKACKVPVKRFYKTQIIKGRHPTRRTPYGMCTVQVSSRALKEKIFTWTDLLYKQYQA